MNKPTLDLSHENCHVCENPLRRDMKKQMERCIHFSCLIRNIDFSIPYLEEKEE